MSLPSRAGHGAPATHDDAAELGVELDLQTALSLARATTAALLNLSPLAHREMKAALTDEVTLLRAIGGPKAEVAANLVAQYLPDAA